MNLNQLLKPIMPLAFISFALQGLSQSRTCGFDVIHNEMLRKNEAYKKAVRLNEKQLQERLALGSKTMAPVYRLPVVVHVIHLGEPVGTGSNISDAQIQSALTSMTQYYRGTLGNSVDAEIEFELAELDPNCNATTGIQRIDGSAVANYSTSGLVTGVGGNEIAVKNLSRWPSSRYYNIWIVAEINGNNGGAGIQGFAYFPGAGPDIDGAVMLYNAFGYDPTASLGYNLKSYTNRNTTATHELGHAFGLYHTFQGDDSNDDGVADVCPSNVDCTADGDMVCDTDPHQRSNSNCPAGLNPCTGAMLGTIVNNYMDYSSEACQDRFTTEQVARMRAYLEQLRPGLISSPAGSPYAYGTYVAPVAASCTPTTNPVNIAGPDVYAGLIGVSINGMDFVSSDATSDGGYVDGASCLNEVVLYPGSTYSFSATVYALNQEQVRAWIDYNNDGVFDNTTEQVFYANNIPSSSNYVTVSANFTVPMSATTNTSLRLRIIDELGTAYGAGFAITGGCYNPEYGQGEDYLARIASVLPVTLIDFTGKLEAGKVVLRWNTAEEHNSKLFEVQRATDGVNFQTIGSVNAAINSTGLKRYSLTDANPALVNHYRLKMIDQDGQVRLSDIVVIKNPDAVQNIWVRRNPVRQQIDIGLVRNAVQANLQLVNATGAVVAEKTFNNTGGEISWALGGHLSPGVYFLRAIVDGQLFTQKIIKE